MPKRTSTYIKYPWDGGVNASIDPGLLNDNDLVTADNVVFGTSGSRLKREGIDFIDTALPNPDSRASSGTTRTLFYTSSNLLPSAPALDELLVVGERISVTTTAASGNETSYIATSPITEIAAVQEVTTVQCIADSAGSLNNSYFFLNAGNAGTGYYVWYNVNSAGVDPSIVGRTGIEVTISTDAAATAVASATQTAIDQESDFSATVLTDTVTITAADGGFTAEPSDPGATGFTISVTTEGGHSVSYAASGTLSEAQTATATISAARASSVVNLVDYWRFSSGTKQQQLLSATDNFQLFKYDSANRRTQILGELQVSTVACNAASTLASSGAGDYFLLSSGNDVTNYYVWFDVDGGNNDPSILGRTGVEVDVAAADTDAQVATKLSTAIDALTDFSATVNSVTVTVTNADQGEATAAVDQNTGFTISTPTLGASAPTSQQDTIDSIVFNERAIFTFSEVGDKPIQYRPESSSRYQALGGSPPDCSIITEYQGRLWTDDKSDPDRVHYSSPGNHEEWSGVGDSGAIDISTGDGDPSGITSIFPFKGILFVAKRGRLFRITGDTPESYRVEPVSSGIGSESHQAVTAVDQDDVVFVSKRGFHSILATDAFGDVENSFISASIQPLFNAWNQERLKFIQGVYVPELNSLAFAVSENASNNDNIWLFNVIKKSWYRWPNITCQALSARRVQGATKIILGTTDGRVRQAQNGVFSDNSSSSGISYKIQSGTIYPGGNPNSYKSFKKLGFFYRPKGNFEFTVTVKIDNQSVQTLSFTQESGGDRLDVDFVLGQSILGTSNTLAPFTKQIDGFGRGLTIDISQTGTEQQVEIFGFMLEYEEAGDAQEVILADSSQAG